MEAGLHLALTYLLHAVRVETRFQQETSARTSLTERKRKYLEALPDDRFSTGEAKELASHVGVSERNVQRWLKDWRKAGLLTKPKRGTWAKLTPALEGAPGAGSVISVITDIPALAGAEAT
jgi:DNA-binding transcriptional ArsR family regulator